MMNKIKIVDRQERMNVVECGGLDDDMYESALEELENMQIKYNELVEYNNELESHITDLENIIEQIT